MFRNCAERISHCIEKRSLRLTELADAGIVTKGWRGSSSPLSNLAASFVAFTKRPEGLYGIGAGGCKTLLQPRCHTLALHGVEAEEQLLEKPGVSALQVDEAWSGTAGAFGLARETPDVGVAIAKHGLLPNACAAPDAMLVRADGFSCREQLRTGAGRRAFRTAELAVPDYAFICRPLLHPKRVVLNSSLLPIERNATSRPDVC